MTTPTPAREPGYIEELERALEKATPGPWKTYFDDWSICDDSGHVAGTEKPEDAKLIVLAINALPQLLVLAKLAMLVREGGEEVVEKVARAIALSQYGDDSVWDRAFITGTARAVLRTLEGLIK